MKTLAAHDENFKKAAKEAAVILKKGGIVIYPTETAYACGADATNDAAVKKIFKLKKRNPKKTLPLIAADLAMVKRYASLEGETLDLAKKNWPGPLTLVLPVKGNKLSPLTIKNHTIAIRVSSHPLSAALTGSLGKPITSTSANYSGEGAVYSSRRIRRDWSKASLQPDLFLNAGNLPIRKPSTIVYVSTKGIRILRQGSIKCKL